MGYLVHLTIKAKKEYQIRFKKDHLKTAKIIESNMNENDLVSDEKSAIFVIDDKNNHSVVDSDLFSNFFYWEQGYKPFDNQKLSKFQYLEFELDSIPFYVCLFTGIENSYCLIKIFPHIEIEYGITGWIDFKDDFYEENTYIEF